MADEGLIMIRWKTDKTVDPVMFRLVCENDDPAYSELTVSLSSAEVTERVARARLIGMMFEKARQMKIDGTRLRFQVNGIEE